ncbi:lysosomal acid phosphatase-like isoform X3, partial [Leptotrombidium deliense]
SFLAEIRNQINLIASNNTFDSVRIYSGTDILIGGIFSALGVSDNRRAPVGSAVMFEFYESDLYPKNFVRFYYLHDTYSERPNLLTIYNCLTDEMCSFEKFKKQIEKYIPNDWRYECGLK